MDSQFDLSEIHDVEFDVSNSGITRELIVQQIAAGIIFFD
jgi:hypothetical protein